MKQEELLRQWIEDSLATKRKFFSENTDKILALCDALRDVKKEGKKALIFGNGGSAADAQHFAAELIHRVEKKVIGLRAFALHTDTSVITAIGNDEGFDRIYARQIQVLAEPGDLAIAITTSGNSTNILEALQAARERKCLTAGLLGRTGGKALDLCNVALVVDNQSTPRIQETHGMIIHLVCQLLENT
jgi:D-sedoheptulose 7-phosphate isomerase